VESATGDVFGLERVGPAVSQRLHLPGGQLLEELVGEVKSFAARGELTDDVCLVAVELSHLMPAKPRVGQPQPTAK
jgi:serine phosphatase RsbU (regulator of sigma subunit)